MNKTDRFDVSPFVRGAFAAAADADLIDLTYALVLGRNGESDEAILNDLVEIAYIAYRSGGSQDAYSRILQFRDAAARAKQGAESCERA